MLVGFASVSAVVMTLAFLGTLLFRVVLDGWSTLDWEFLWAYPSATPELAGIKPALYGTVYVMALVALLVVPLGVGAALYLEEYARKGLFARVVELNIQNLAAVPAIVYGLLAAGIFVKAMRLGESVITGALTLSLLVMPLVIIASREAIRSVPASLPEGAYALGCTRWQVSSRVVLPAAFRGIVTGVILALSRAIGEAAPLVTIGALTYVSFEPRGLGDRFTVLPIQIFNWVSRPQAAYHRKAAAAIIVLVVVLLGFNSVAIWMRARSEKARLEWQT